MERYGPKTLKSLRTLAVFGAALYLAFGVAVRLLRPDIIDPMAPRAALAVWLVCLAAALHRPAVVRRLDPLISLTALAATAHMLWLVGANGLDALYVLLLIELMFGVSLIVERRNQLLGVYAWTVLGAAFVGRDHPPGETALLVLLLVANAGVAYIGLRGRLRLVAELRGETARLDGLVSAFKDAHFKLADDGRVVAPSDGLPPGLAAPDAVLAAELAAARERLATGAAYASVVHKLHEGHKTRTYEIRLVAVEPASAEGEPGGPSETLGIVRDVSELAEAAKAVALQSRILDTMSEAVIVAGGDGRVIFGNAAQMRVFGHAASALEGSLYSQLFGDGEAEQAAFRGTLDLGLRERGFWRGEASGIRQDGSRFPCRIEAAALEEGDARLRLFVVEDISEQKRLASDVSRLAAVVQDSVDAIVTTDRDGLITSWNRGAERLFGYLEAEAVGQTMELVTPPELAPEADDILDNLLRGGWLHDFETRRRNKKGRLIDVAMTVSPLRHGSTAPTGMSVVIRDISERRRIEQSLEEERTRAMHASKMAGLGIMAGGIAHEINNPLAIIKGYADHLLRGAQAGGVPADELASRAAKMAAMVTRIAKIIKGLRSLSRESSRDPLEQTPLDQIVQDVLSICEERIRLSGIELRVDRADGIAVECRATEIGHVLINLIANAVDAVADLPERWIHLGIEAREAEVEISVTDSGDGIAPGQLEKILVPFYTTKVVGKGTGLGLSIAQTLVESNNGRFSYDASCPNTRFTFILLRAQPQKSAA